MTSEQYLALAKRSGATVYTNRHYPLQPAVAFSNSAWLKFCQLIESPQSLVSDDPCSGCRPGVACRTPSCGRLTKINLAKSIATGLSVTQALDALDAQQEAYIPLPEQTIPVTRAAKAWDDHEALTFHPIDKNGGKTGWPPGLLQDDSRGLSKWLATRPDSLYVFRKNQK